MRRGIKLARLATKVGWRMNAELAKKKQDAKVQKTRGTLAKAHLLDVRAEGDGRKPTPSASWWAGSRPPLLPNCEFSKGANKLANMMTPFERKSTGFPRSFYRDPPPLDIFGCA